MAIDTSNPEFQAFLAAGGLGLTGLDPDTGTQDVLNLSRDAGDGNIGRTADGGYGTFVRTPEGEDSIAPLQQLATAFDKYKAAVDPQGRSIYGTARTVFPRWAPFGSATPGEATLNGTPLVSLANWSDGTPESLQAQIEHVRATTGFDPIYTPELGYVMPYELQQTAYPVQDHGWFDALASMAPMLLGSAFMGFAPALQGAAALTPTQSALLSAARGAITGAGGGLQGMLTGALTGGLGSGLAPGANSLLSSITDSPILAGAIRGGAQGLLSSALQGGDPLRGALSGAVSGSISPAASQIANAFTPIGAIESALPAFAETELDWQAPMSGQAPFQQVSSEGSLPGLASPDSISNFLGTVPDAIAPNALPGLASQDSISNFLNRVQEAVPGSLPGLSSAGALGAFLENVPGSMTGASPTGEAPSGSMSDFAENVPGTPTGQPLPAPMDLGNMPTGQEKEAPAKTAGTAYANAAKLVFNVYQSVAGEAPAVEPYSAPTRQKGQTDSEYAEFLVGGVSQYLNPKEMAGLNIDTSGLDVATLRDQGLTPGTPQYLQAVLVQLDSIIAQLYGSDPSALLAGESPEDLQQAVRGKTSEEMRALMRALNVRGQLDGLSFAESAADPFTGRSQQLSLAPGQGTQSDIAAYQRGIAELGGDIAGAAPTVARGMLSGLLARNPDLFGLQRSADARRLRDMLASTLTAGERKRAPGMLGLSDDDSASFWQSVLESRDPRMLERLLGDIGGQERQAMAAEELLNLG